MENFCDNRHCDTGVLKLYFFLWPHVSTCLNYVTLWVEAPIHVLAPFDLTASV